MEDKNKDLFKDALRKKLFDEPIHDEAEDLVLWKTLKAELPLAPAKKKGHVVHMWYAYAAAGVAFLLLASIASYFLFSTKTVPHEAHTSTISDSSNITRPHTYCFRCLPNIFISNFFAFEY